MAKDIDFDELDKAVNSLMGKVGEDPTDTTPKQKTLAINSTLKPDEKPQYDVLGKAAEKIGSETLGTNDYTVVETLPAAPANLPPIPQALPTVAPAPVAVTKPEHTEPVAPHPKSGRFLDVMHPSADMRSVTVPPRPSEPESRPFAPTTVPAVAKEESVKPDVPAPAAVNPFPPTPVTSPFLPDAKVEKRPLGGDMLASEPVEQNDPVEKIVETEVINNDAQAVDNGSGDEQRPLDANDFDNETSAEEQKLQAIESADVADTSHEAIRAVESADTGKVTDAAANSAAGIYDVDKNAKPLAHPAKQKSGWGAVVIIVAIIVVAIAAGAAAYFIFVKP